MAFNTLLRSLKPGLAMCPLKLQVRTMAYGRKIAYKEPTLSEMPVPDGSWATNYAITNRRYTTHLILGLSFFLITQFIAFRSGLITLNYSPPPLDGSFGGGSQSQDGCDPPPPKC